MSSKRRDPVRVFAIDPGYRYESGAGWAYLEDGVLVAAGLVSSSPGDHRRGIPGGLDKTFEVLRQLEPVFRRHPQVDIAVAEMMQHYPDRQDSQPNVLIPLSALSGFVLGRIQAEEYLYPLPSEWKGQVPKAVHNRRTERALTSAEQKVVSSACAPSKRHNVLDAVALAKWAHRRKK